MPPMICVSPVKTGEAIASLGLYGWGTNATGQLGKGYADSSNAANYVPAAANPETNWWKVISGDTHGVALKRDGTLWTWGSNSSGQLGRVAPNTSAAALTPTQVGIDTDWVDISAGPNHTLALKRDGTLWSCGNSNSGQLGHGNTTASSVLKKIGTDTDWASCSCGGSSSYAVKTDGTLYAWGGNLSGQLGKGTTTNVVANYSPVAIIGGIKQVSANRSGTVLALTFDGSIYGCGISADYQLGVASTQSSFIYVGGGAEYISSGGRHSIALGFDGKLYGCGTNVVGTLGTGNTTALPVAERVYHQLTNQDSDWMSVSCSNDHTSALKRDGTLWTWGSNSLGQLGHGDNTQSGAAIITRNSTPSRIGTDLWFQTSSYGGSFNLALRR